MITLVDGEDSFLNHEKLLWFILQLASVLILAAWSVTDNSKISGKDLLAAAGCRQILTPKTLPVAAAAAANVSGSPLFAANASSSLSGERRAVLRWTEPPLPSLPLPPLQPTTSQGEIHPVHRDL